METTKGLEEGRVVTKRLSKETNHEDANWIGLATGKIE
jgi:hypothetical protein